MATEPAGAESADATTNGDILLTATDVSKRFGGLLAVDTVTFEIPRRSIVSIIGPNGAGKTTFFNMLTGLYKPRPDASRSTATTSPRCDPIGS